MNEFIKRFQVRVLDNRDPRGEFACEFDTLEEAKNKVAEFENHREEILNSDEPDYVKSHYRPLFWKIVDMKDEK